MTDEPARIIVDGDLALYRILSRIEREVQWGHDVWTLSTNEQEGRDLMLHQLKVIRRVVTGSEDSTVPMIVCFSGPHNFRKDVMPTYKSQRVKTRKPMCFKVIKDWLRENDRSNGFRYAEMPNLEGDDLLGLLATQPGYEGRCVIVSDDKDLKQVPGSIYRFPEYEGPKPKDLKREVLEVTAEEGDRFFYAQAAAGDVTDGYHGAPGIGLQTALELLEGQLMLKPKDKVISRGPRAGQTVTEWARVSAPSPWDTVVSCYHKAGLTEDDALQNARVARMLRWGEYDFTKQEVRLWEPPGR